MAPLVLVSRNLVPLMDSSLKSKSLTAFVWGGGGALLRLVLQLGSQIVLARLLGPEQYGLFAIGVMVISLSNFFAELGLAYGLIQRPSVSDQDIRFVFTWQVILGGIVCGLLVLSASAIAEFFAEARVEAVVRALAPMCLLQAISAVSLSLLKREINYKAIQITQICGYVMGYIATGIPLALMGYEVWALVWAWCVQVVVSLIMAYTFCRHPLRLKFLHPDCKDMMDFGFKVLATNLVNWVVSNADRVVVARTLPPHLVGLYTTSYNLMFTPAGAAMGVIQPVMYSACSQVQGDLARIREAYLTIASAISIALLPLFIVLAVIPETFIRALYGDVWIEAASLITPLALAMPFFLLWNITTPALWTIGRLTSELKLQTFISVLWIGFAFLAVRLSLVAVAWTVFGLFVFRFIIFSCFLGKFIDLPFNTNLRVLRGGFIIAVVVACIATATDRIMLQLGVDLPIYRLLVVFSTSLFSYFLAIWLYPQLFDARLIVIVRAGALKVSPRFARALDQYFRIGPAS